jgi:ribosomal protein L7/L12
VTDKSLHDLTEGDAQDLARIMAQIKQLGESLAEEGHTRGFQIYKMARDGMEILCFDRISRDAIAKLAAASRMFRGHVIDDQVEKHIRSGQMIDAIKHLRMLTGLGLKEAKDWCEAYRSHLGIAPRSW